MKLVSVVAATLVIALGITISAQRGQGRGGPGGPPGRGGGPGDPADAIREVQDALTLTPPQVDRLRALFQTFDQDEQRARTEGADLALPALNAKFRADVIALLTPDQQKVFANVEALAAPAAAFSRLGILPPPAGGRGVGGRGGPGGLGGPGGRGGGVDGLRPLAVPDENPMTPEKIALGRSLFFDTRLSQDQTMSCATCHQPDHGFSDGRAVAVGIHGAKGSRNTPTLVDAGYGRSFFWDGRADTLEHQVLGPIVNPIEMGSSEPELERRTGLKAADVAAALASYVRTISSHESRYDWYQAGQTQMLTAQERAGLDVFRGRGQCVVCHGGPNFTDDRFHNTGVAFRDGHILDEGRFVVTGDERDHGAFKTPTLRDVALTAPYMHDGSLATLEDVVNYYSDDVRRNTYLDPRMHPSHLTPAEKQSLVAFMRTLTGRMTEGIGPR